MMVFGRGLAVGMLALLLGGAANAQENLDSGKSPAQLYASDCAICHKSPQGLASKSGKVFGVESFLREHYTASRETAAAIAGYLNAMDSGPAAPAKGAKKGAKGDSKGGEKKSGSKSGDSKSGDAKPADAKSDAKSDAKPADAKPAETKPAESKPAESKSEPKPADSPKPE